MAQAARQHDASSAPPAQQQQGGASRDCCEKVSVLAVISFAAMALVGGLALCGVMRPDSIFKVMGDKFTQTGAIVVTTIGGLGAVTFVIIICIHQRRRQSACRQKAHDHVGDDAAPQPRQVIPGRVRGDAAPQPPRAAPDRFGDDGDDEAPDPRWAAPQPRQVIPGRVRGDAAPQPPRAAAAPDHFGDEASDVHDEASDGGGEARAPQGASSDRLLPVVPDRTATGRGPLPSNPVLFHQPGSLDDLA